MFCGLSKENWYKDVFGAQIFPLVILFIFEVALEEVTHRKGLERRAAEQRLVVSQGLWGQADVTF